MLIKCRFLDENGVPKGREYTYGANEEFQVGEIVATAEGKSLVVTSLEVDPAEAEKFGDKLRFVQAVIEEEATEIAVQETVNTDLIIVQQLPVIIEKLESVKAEVLAKVETAKSLVCTEETCKEIKKSRADLNKQFTAFEEQRKAVKTAVAKPYMEFEAKYKECIADIYKLADSDLKAKIDEVENGLKDDKRNEVIEYFTEYRNSKHIDFVEFGQSGLNITLSASLKSLKEQAKTFIDKIADDLELIETQDHKEEILVEFKKTLNCSQAITTVVARHKAIEEQKARQAELQARKEAELQAAKKVEEVATIAPPIIEPPKVIDARPAEPIFTVSFKVTATKSELAKLKAFLVEGGYKYE